MPKVKLKIKQAPNGISTIISASLLSYEISCAGHDREDALHNLLEILYEMSEAVTKELKQINDINQENLEQIL